ncbi:MAG TPA: tetratricopeptide repeat protein [Steroidobacteraceae bacterium]|nr:tetratricopeptide repeat protein [Steroidobacteraceae bacterium]
MTEGQIAATFREAIRLQQQGRHAESDALCSAVIEAQPWHYAALHLKGLLALERGNVAHGIDLIQRSLSINHEQPEAYSNVGNALLAAHRADDALACFDEALRIKPAFANAHFNRGLALAALGRASEALESYERALQLRPQDPRASAQRAAALCALGRVEDALACCDTLLRREPDLAEGHEVRGAVLLALGRNAEALKSFERALELALRDPDAHYGRGNALFRLGRAAEALAAFDAALALKPDFPEALNNRSTTLCALQRAAEALASAEEALRLKPTFDAAHFSRGIALQALERHREALLSYDQALALHPNPDAHTNAGAALAELGEHEAALARFEAALALDPRHTAALANRGYTLSRLQRHSQAAEAFARLRELAPTNDAALGHLLNSRLHSCDWQDWSTSAAAVIERVRAGRAVMRPLDFLAVSHSASEQLQCARIAAAGKARGAPAPLWRGERYGHDRVRIAYLSGNFGQHPVWQLLVGVVERHDAARFEVTGISLGDDGSPMARRIRSVFPRFVDVHGRSDQEIAGLVRDLEIDIAIDLQGFTEGMHDGVFQRRPAPIQVNYLGYPGTLGAAHWDYILADEVVIPPGEERWYAEQVARLPHCYLPNDDRRGIDPTPRRAEQGLPREGTVLCAFANPSKINPPMFELWLRLLGGIPDSVLWLRGWPPAAVANLRREAQRGNIASERLVFAAPSPTGEQHLGTMRLADLFLDTLPYNAHSTACEALWAGVPVLTCLGQSFAGRVAASALRAVGMEELITHGLADYERLACELGRDRQRLATLKARLAANRLRAPLFDTARYCLHLEQAYLVMRERAERGEPPRGFSVEPQPETPRQEIGSEKTSVTTVRVGSDVEFEHVTQSRSGAALLNAIAHVRRGELELAESLLRTLLHAEPRHPEALHQLGLLCLRTQRAKEGAERIRESLRVAPAQPGAHMHLGIALRRLGCLDQAIESFDAALRLKPELAEALYNRANTLEDLGRLEEALADLDEALRLSPRFIAALGRRGDLLMRLSRDGEALNDRNQVVQLVAEDDASGVGLLGLRANALRELGRAEEALATLERALRLKPDAADLWNDRSIVMRDLKRVPEALESAARALRLDPESAEALSNHGDALRDAARFSEALTSYEQALRLKPRLAAAYRGRGMALQGLRRPAEALVEFAHAERLGAVRLDVLNQRGNALLELDRFEDALECYEQALALMPDQQDLLWNRGSALRRLHRYREAIDCLTRLLELAPDYEFALGLLVYCRLELCDWHGYDELRGQLLARLKPNARVAEPFAVLALTDSARAQLECARSFAGFSTTVPSAVPRPRGYRHSRIRVAYLSGDLREHAVSYLMAGVFEGHDRERFEITGLSLRPAEDSIMGRRLRGAFDRFLDVSARTDTEIAALMHELEIDVAVDLMGYTEHQRFAVFTHRPAPVQATYLGYPGTTGSSALDYILADEFVITEEQCNSYLERVVYLPGCFQANDDRRVSRPRPTRASCGLPATGLVLCCFNAALKLNPAMFDVWCRLLRAVPHSVLWLVAHSGAVRANLRHEAAARGVDPGRLVFAQMLPYPEHLARMSLADLFLDTFPFSAGATASDALWAGVPLITCVGQAYASRMAGSLLRSLGLPELVTTSFESYERRALELAQNPASLVALHRRLEENRRTAAAFDTARFCCALERAYTIMWERAERGEPPEAFSVSDSGVSR